MSAVLELESAGFRPMREQDLDQVMEIERDCYAFPWTEGIYLDCLRVGYSCWVLETPTIPVGGYGVMAVAAGEAHVLNLCIRPELQRKGFGRALLQHMLDVARQHHAEMVFLEVRPSNRPAITLYRTAGFSEVGTRRGYYPAEGGREDALILARDLRSDFA